MNERNHIRNIDMVIMVMPSQPVLRLAGFREMIAINRVSMKGRFGIQHF